MSRFIISLLLFLLINIIATRALPHIESSCQRWHNKAIQELVHKDIVDPKKNQDHTWTEWALMDFDKQKDNPSSVIFLGSSLMLMPINLADAHYLNRIVDGAVHHESCLFNYLINHGKGDRNCLSSNFNFALPGLMPSDAYLLTKLFLSGESHPKLIVYGVGPRDFLDNLLLSPTATDPYHCLSRYLSKSLRSSFIGSDWQSRLNCFLSEHFALYEQREKINGALTNMNIFTVSDPSIRMSMQKLHVLLPSYNPMAISLNDCLFSPNPPTDPYRFTRDLNEYRLRYRRVDWDIFICQTKFFLDLLKLASDRKIKVLIVAMPITSVNQQLLPDYIYAAYKENLRVLSRSCGAHFIDFNDSGLFSDQDFVDTVHLNTAGGTRLLKLLSKYVSQHRLLDQDKGNHLRLADTGIKL